VLGAFLLIAAGAGIGIAAAWLADLVVPRSELDAVKRERDRAIAARDAAIKEREAAHAPDPLATLIGPDFYFYKSQEIPKQSGTLELGSCPEAPCYAFQLHGVALVGGEDQLDFRVGFREPDGSGIWPPELSVPIPPRAGCRALVSFRSFEAAIFIEGVSGSSVRAGIGIRSNKTRTDEGARVQSASCPEDDSRSPEEDREIPGS
jgi:hypothetical protein